jgi:hypothetical protein
MMKNETESTGMVEPTMYRISWKSLKKFEDFQRNFLTKLQKYIIINISKRKGIDNYDEIRT